MSTEPADTEEASPAAKVYVVDDEEAPREMIGRTLSRAGYRVERFASARSALEALRASDDEVDLLLTDLDMPDVTGRELLSEVRREWPELVSIVITGANDVATAVEVMREGAYDYLVKPVDPEYTLIPAVVRALSHKRLIDRNVSLQRQLDPTQRTTRIVGESERLKEVLSVVSAVAPTDASVLIIGETGTGKELIARAIHEQSRRASRPFVAINCGALSESVLESELFGHARGAFTGASGSRRGLFEEASGGTVFLDEVGELSPATQVRFLRVLQEGQVRPVGSNKPVTVDTRIIAATNRNLAADVESGEFREDLFYRLDVVRVELPPLRARQADIPLLVNHFLQRRGARLGKVLKSVDAEVLARFAAHPWPGNIRELENTIDRAIVLAKGDTVTPDLLPTLLREAPRAAHPDARYLLPLTEAKTQFESEYVERVMSRAMGKQAEAAKLAGVDRSNFRRLLKRLNLDPGEPKSG